MKMTQKIFFLALLGSSLSAVSSRGEHVAAVTVGTANLRGQPSLASEVVAQVHQGDKVIVLEEVPVEKPKAGEPAKWAKVQLPENTPVWVFSSMISNKVVAVSRLNFRSGPGQNYSVLGRLDKGAEVKELRSTNGWTEIEPPDTAYAFIAADLIKSLEPEKPAVAAASTNAPVAHPAPAAAKVSSPPAAQTPAAEPKTTEAPAPLDPGAIAEKAAPKETAPAETAAAVEPAPAAPAVAEVQPEPAAPSPTAAVQPRRIVRREGIVRSTRSIQAPTYFELVSPDTRKTINYLHHSTPDIQLKDYKGRRVVVSGEEGIDQRWPKTPVIEVETLELAP